MAEALLQINFIDDDYREKRVRNRKTVGTIRELPLRFETNLYFFNGDVLELNQ